MGDTEQSKAKSEKGETMVTGYSVQVAITTIIGVNANSNREALERAESELKRIFNEFPHVGEGTTQMALAIVGTDGWKPIKEMRK